MLEQLEKFKTEIFALLSLVGGFFIGRRRNNAEAANSEADADKKKAEEEAIRVQMVIDLQNSLLTVQKSLDDMREKNDQMYKARESERDARRAEQERILANQSTIMARNEILSDKLAKQEREAFERELASQNKIAELEKRIEGQGQKLVVIEKKTGSLEDKMPKHE